jgi:aspartate carbamoyltransferase catalytic subunit
MRHFLSISDFKKEEIDTILNWANTIEIGWEFCRSMNNKCITSFFAEPSTRTRFSFERAMHWLGGRIVTAADASSSSSLVKGESLKDTIRTLGQYSDAIVIRHNDPNWPEVARQYSRVPVINAGSGSGEHPTQALLDLHTIKQNGELFEILKF